MLEQAWHHTSIEQTCAEFRVDPAIGLDEGEAQARLAQYGKNVLQEQPRPGFLGRLLNQFKNVIVLLLIGASLVSALLGEWYEAGAIILIVILNALLGVIQEGRAEQALAALKKLAAPEAHLLRGGHLVTVSAEEIVPGDVVILEAGSYVPADLRLIESANLQIAEASLTGEAVPVSKSAAAILPEKVGLGDRKNMAYKSTIVTYGRGRGVIVATGMQTELGQIAEMIQSVEEEQTPLQRRLDQLGRWLAYGSLAICGVVFLVIFGRAADDIALELGLTSVGAFVGALNHPSLLAALRQAGVDAFLTSVALAVAAVPEGLAAVVTINLALGMREMIARNALIRHLPAVETLGSASAICSDKTGTLTQNEMTAVKLYVPDVMVDVTGEGYQPDGVFHRDGESLVEREHADLVRLLRGALLASDARLETEASSNGMGYTIVGDPTEGALVVAAAKANLTREELEADFPRLNELPFDSERKRMSTLYRDHSGEDCCVLYVKGAPDIVLDRCESFRQEGVVKPLSAGMRQHIEDVNRDLARQALRVLAVAERRFDSLLETLDPEEHEARLTFVGLVGMIDPARPEVKPAIERARQAGIKTVMVTGDYPDTAQAIATQIGLLNGDGGRIMTGAELEEVSDAQLAEAIDDVAVFARVSPRHKVRIVDAFRDRDYVVAMTGDGVNDAPALKRASIGVAMGITGTDVSKETADMVLTDDNYVSIVNAVEQGRIIYDNIRKFVYFLLSCNLAEIMVILLGTLMGYPSPLSAIQLLWLNLLTDGAPALALGVEKGDPDVMRRAPRPANEPIIDHTMRVGMVVQTIFITAVTLTAYFFGIRLGGLVLGRSMAFTVLSSSELARAYSSRSEYFSVLRIGLFSNKYMQYAVLASVGLLLLVIYVPFFNGIFDTVPLTLGEWALLLPLIFLPTIAAELTKLVMRLTDRQHPANAAA
jgi:Ca2+-transporting ATPase